MKTLLASVCAAAFAAAFVHAAPADDLATAAKKLGDAANYSWTTTTEMANAQFTPGPVTGQTEKGGYTVVTREFNGNSLQTVRKGEQLVMQNQQGEWMTMEEMRQQFANRGGGGNRGGGNGGGGGGGNRGGARGGFGGGFGGGQADPAMEAFTLATKVQDVKTAEGVIVGTLSAADAAPLLAFGGGMGGRGGRGGQGGGGGDGGGRGGNPPPAPKNVSATVSFWVKDGAVTKFAVSVKGTVTTPNGDEREMARTMTTEFKDVGTTRVVVPEAVKQKLGG